MSRDWPRIGEQCYHPSVPAPQQHAPCHQTLSLPSREAIIADARRSFTEALPRIEGLASAYLRARGSERKDDEIAEVVAITWKGYLDLSLRGENVNKLLGKIVGYAATSVRSGRLLVGQPSVNDVMSPRAQVQAWTSRGGHHGWRQGDY